MYLYSEHNLNILDSQLIKKCIKGDVSAQTILYGEYAPKMFAVCMRYAPDRSTAEDILQEGFITVFKKLKTFKGQSELIYWIRRVIINTALQHLRKYNNPRYQFIDIDDCYDIDNGEDLFEKMSLDEVFEIIQQIPNDYREILNLYAVDGYSHKEISELLGISEVSSKKRLSRARVALKAIVKKNERIKI